MAKFYTDKGRTIEASMSSMVGRRVRELVRRVPANPTQAAGALARIGGTPRVNEPR